MWAARAPPPPTQLPRQLITQATGPWTNSWQGIDTVLIKWVSDIEGLIDVTPGWPGGSDAGYPTWQTVIPVPGHDSPAVMDWYTDEDGWRRLLGSDFRTSSHRWNLGWTSAPASFGFGYLLIQVYLSLNIQSGIEFEWYFIQYFIVFKV